MNKVAVLVLALAACRQSHPTPDDTRSQDLQPPSISLARDTVQGADNGLISVDSTRILMLLAAEQFGTTEEAIRARLGQPQDVQLSRPVGEWAERGDSIVSLQYSGLTIGLYRVLPERRDLLGHVVLSDSGYALPSGVRIGASREVVLAAIGTPNSRHEDGMAIVWEYVVGETDETIRFRFAGQRLVQVEWTLFID